MDNIIQQRLQIMDDIEMAQSLKFSGYSCRLSQKSISPQKRNRYICYKCGGDNEKSKKCNTCRGLRTVQSNDNLVQLLNQVLSCKLMVETANNLQLPQIRENIKHCSEIKEQSELIDKYIICDICQAQMNENKLDFMYCKQCEYFYVCQQCFCAQNFDHQHKLQKYNLGESEKWSKSEIDSEQQTIKVCQCCFQQIEDRGIYLSCQNCKNQGVFYEICSKCSDKKKHKHSFDHIFKPSLYRAPRKNQRNSNVMQEEQNWVEQKGKFHQSQIFVEQGEEEDDRDYKVNIWADAPIKQQKIPRKSQPVFRYKGLSPTKNNPSINRVKFEQTDSQYSENWAKSKNTIQSGEKFRPEMIESEYEQQEEYIFEDYECDRCQKNPQNNRYHCLTCEDYDLCQQCYKKNNKQNFHDNHQFEKITKKDQQKLMAQKQHQVQQNRKKLCERKNQIKKSITRKSMF